jgi:hypothetical protein
MGKMFLAESLWEVLRPLTQYRMDFPGSGSKIRKSIKPQDEMYLGRNQGVRETAKQPKDLGVTPHGRLGNIPPTLTR